jgi:hypothetical protein
VQSLVGVVVTLFVAVGVLCCACLSAAVACGQAAYECVELVQSLVAGVDGTVCVQQCYMQTMCVVGTSKRIKQAPWRMCVCAAVPISVHVCSRCV